MHIVFVPNALGCHRLNLACSLIQQCQCDVCMLCWSSTNIEIITRATKAGFGVRASQGTELTMLKRITLLIIARVSLFIFTQQFTQ